MRPHTPRFAAIAAFTGLVFVSLLAAASPVRLRPLDLLEVAPNRLGQVLELEIVEPLHGPSTPEALARAEYGQVRVAIPEGGNADLSLVPDSFRMADPSRYRGRFDRVLAAPLRVRGTLLEDAELSRPNRPAYLIRVEAMEAMEPAPPIRVGSVDELANDRGRFDRTTIEIVGTHESRFEVSAFEKKVWLSRSPDAKVVGVAPEGWGTRRVRVVGTLFARPGAHYGHLGGYPMMLLAREIEYLP